MEATVPDGGVLRPQDFDPFDPQTQQHPDDWYAALRTQAPVFHVADRALWFVTSRELVIHALEQPRVFSSRFGQPQAPPSTAIAERLAGIQAQGWPQVPTILTEDPPAHHYYRRLVARAFTPRFVQRLEPAIRRLSAGLVDDLLAADQSEFVRDFAIPLPIAVIAGVLAVPADRLADLKRWSDAFASSIGAQVDDQRRVEQAEHVVEFQHYFADQLQRRQSDPQDDLLTGLLRAHLTSQGTEDPPLTTAACLSVITQLLVAGNETTTKLLTGAVFELGRNPTHWAWLRDDPDTRVDKVIDEALRYLTPVQGMFRVVTRPTSLGGVDLPAGARVVLCYGSANRDHPTLVDPDTFDPQRNGCENHLAFGHGIHYCLGAPLARLQARVALRELATRVASYTLTDRNDYRYEPSFLLRGLTQLHCRFRPAECTVEFSAFDG